MNSQMVRPTTPSGGVDPSHAFSCALRMPLFEILNPDDVVGAVDGIAEDVFVHSVLRYGLAGTFISYDEGIRDVYPWGQTLPDAMTGKWQEGQTP